MDMTRRISTGLCIFFLAAIGGCVNPVSKDLRLRVDEKQTFSTIRENPGAYRGSTVLWGGVIETIRQRGDETRIIVSQAPLDSDGYPLTQGGGGEFIAHTSQALNPEIFRQGSKITLVGEIEGAENDELGSETKFPVVRIVEIHAWERSWGRFPITKGWEFNQYSRSPGPDAGNREPPFAGGPPPRGR